MWLTMKYGALNLEQWPSKNGTRRHVTLVQDRNIPLTTELIAQYESASLQTWNESTEYACCIQLILLIHFWHVMGYSPPPLIGKHSPKTP